ncbi:MAG: gamma-glutamyltransferase [Nocardioidaceae bacterium]|nr:gamma-glutamyltransferase [Nocardioidaceae bacterium]
MTEPVAPSPVPALGTRGAVSSSHPAVSQLGAHVLAGGGNAFDATLAMAALSWLVLPGQCGLGGDAFVMVRERDGRVWTLNGSGFGPDGGTPDFYRAHGLDALPLGGPLAVAVPGAPAVVGALHERASRSLTDLWGPAIDAALDGVPCTAKTLADISEHAAGLAADPGAREVFLPEGRLPRVGDRLRHADLARTLTLLAGDLGAFYTGWFAERAVSSLLGDGAPFTGEEWALGGRMVPEAALHTSYGGLVLHETPLPTPGWMVLHQARLLDGRIAQSEPLGAEAVHWFAEAARASFRHRFATGSYDDAWQRATTEDALAETRERIGSFQASGAPGLTLAGDTTSTVCVDADGTAVSFIHSLAFTFGARTTVPGTGVLLNNRLGRGAYLIDGHPNEVMPRRKPMHTLNAWLLTDGDDLVALGNCPGGDGQVQWNMQVVSHLVDHGTGVQRAVSLPRVTVHPGSDADVLGAEPVLRVEDGIDVAVTDRLEAWGHRVERVPAQRGGPGGSALVIGLDQQRGVLAAAADPRMEGVALAL